MIIIKKYYRTILNTAMILFGSGCATNIADNIQPVNNFEINKYLGTWYEIARLDHSFEEGMQNVTANYSMRDDGGIKVVNSGYRVEEKEWSSAEGVAYFMNESKKNEAYLKVSFFRPFYASYVVFEVDKDYQYAFIGGNSKEYLWLLSRTKTVDPAIKNRFISEAKAKGYKTEELIWVSHENR